MRPKRAICARIEHVAGVFVLVGLAEGVELAGVAGADEHVVAGGAVNCSEAQALLRLDVGDIGVVAILLDAEDVATIAADGEHSIGACGERVDDVVFAGPDLARSLVGGDGIDFSAFGRGGAGIRGLQRTGLHDGESDGADALHGKRRKRIVGFVAHAGCVDGAVGADSDGGDFAARSFKEHVAFALRADAIDQAGAVGAGDQVAFCVPRQGTDVLLVALKKISGPASGLEGSMR